MPHQPILGDIPFFNSQPPLQRHLASSSMSVAAPNVVVIGGGIIGASIAWHLSPDAKVTIVADQFGGVATPLSFAWVNADTTDETYYNFRLRSIERWVEISNELPYLPIDLGGALTFNMPSDELAEHLELQAGRGYDVVRVERSEIHEIEHSLVDEAIPDWAILANQEGHMEAEMVALDLIAHAKAHGATVLQDSVTGFIKDSNGRVKGVKTSEGEIQADHVVLAAGLGSVPLLAAENIHLPLSAREGMLVNSLPTKTGLLNKLYNGDKLHMRQTATGVIRSGRDYSGGDPGDDPQGDADELFAEVQAAFKNGHKLEYGGYTIGIRPDPADGYPILGRTGLDGLTVAVMHSGVTNGAIVGKLMAKLVLTNVTDPLMEPYLFSRF
jgi:glycine/D-amino acid oxidase-like deaminating enzyme